MADLPIMLRLLIGISNQIAELQLEFVLLGAILFVIGFVQTALAAGGGWDSRGSKVFVIRALIGVCLIGVAVPLTNFTWDLWIDTYEAGQSLTWGPVEDTLTLSLGEVEAGIASAAGLAAISKSERAQGFWKKLWGRINVSDKAVAKAFQGLVNFGSKVSVAVLKRIPWVISFVLQIFYLPILAGGLFAILGKVAVPLGAGLIFYRAGDNILSWATGLYVSALLLAIMVPFTYGMVVNQVIVVQVETFTEGFKEINGAVARFTGKGVPNVDVENATLEDLVQNTNSWQAAVGDIVFGFINLAFDLFASIIIASLLGLVIIWIVTRTVIGLGRNIVFGTFLSARNLSSGSAAVTTNTTIVNATQANMGYVNSGAGERMYSPPPEARSGPTVPSLPPPRRKA